MKRNAPSDLPPLPTELSGEIEAANTLITFLLGQRLGGNPDRVIAFTRWEKRVRTELLGLQEQARIARLSMERDHPEATAAAAGVGGGR